MYSSLADSYGEEGFEYAPDGHDSDSGIDGKPLSDVLNMQVYSPPMQLDQAATGMSAAVSLHQDPGRSSEARI